MRIATLSLAMQSGGLYMPFVTPLFSLSTYWSFREGSKDSFRAPSTDANKWGNYEQFKMIIQKMLLPILQNCVLLSRICFCLYTLSAFTLLFCVSMETKNKQKNNHISLLNIHCKGNICLLFQPCQRAHLSPESKHRYFSWHHTLATLTKTVWIISAALPLEFHRSNVLFLRTSYIRSLT